MLRLISVASVTLTAILLTATPATAQRLSERIENVRQQRAAAERERQQTAAQRLTQMVENVDFQSTRVQQAVQWWSQQTGIAVVVNWESMLIDGVDPDTPITLSLRRVPANQLLSLLLQQASPDEALIAEATPWYVEIMTRRQANRRTVTRVYDIMDLLHPVPNFDNAPQFDLESALDDEDGGSGRGGRGGGRGDGNRGGGGGGGLFGDSDDDREDVDIPSRAERAEELMDMIRTSIEPDIWQEFGGEHASIRFYNGHLIINAPMYVHRQIGTPINVRPRPTLRGSRSTGNADRRANTAPTSERRPAARGVAGRQ
ncbi:MAG: hypothetical protein WD534_14830 [Phycisphaeraceae bacterium]